MDEKREKPIRICVIALVSRVLVTCFGHVFWSRGLKPSHVQGQAMSDERHTSDGDDDDEGDGDDDCDGDGDGDGWLTMFFSAF